MDEPISYETLLQIRENLLHRLALVDAKIERHYRAALETQKLTTFRCDCGRKLLVEGKVIGKEYSSPAPAPHKPCPGEVTGDCEHSWHPAPQKEER